MEEGENWLQPRGRRVEQVTTMGEPEQRVHYHTEAVTEVVPVNLNQHEVFVEHGDHMHGSGGTITGREHQEPEESEHEGDEVFV